MIESHSSRQNIGHSVVLSFDKMKCLAETLEGANSNVTTSDYDPSYAECKLMDYGQ